MSAAGSQTPEIEIAHVLFMDFVGFTLMTMDEQTRHLEALNRLVGGNQVLGAATAEGEVIRLPTGDGMALVFFRNPLRPVECAIELARALRRRPELKLRMGAHSGPVHRIQDISGGSNVSGTGIQGAQRVMDCGDAGHILLSSTLASYLKQVGIWQNHLWDLGACRTKHGESLEVFNLYAPEFGSPEVPRIFRTGRGIGSVSNPGARRVLLADDQPHVLEALRLLLKGEGYEVEMAASPAAVLEQLRRSEFDLLLMDLNYTRDTTSGEEGLDLLARIQNLNRSLPVVVMTAWSTVDLAVAAMQRGACDFVRKPWDNARLLAILHTQIELHRSRRRENQFAVQNRMLNEEAYPRLIAESPAMRGIRELVERVGPSEATVLIRGEMGTGKGVVARSLHSQSGRGNSPWVAFPVGGLAAEVFESELFGHVPGAFPDAKSERIGRLELADGGTLYLSDIANLPLTQQDKLLRALETGEFARAGASVTSRVNVRLICATSGDLEAEVTAGRFRRDLFFWISAVELRVPPLRERREDIPSLARVFLDRHARRYRKTMSGFDPAAMDLLLRHSWPGNIRELQHVVERAVLVGQGETVTGGDLGLRSPPPEA